MCLANRVPMHRYAGSYFRHLRFSLIFRRRSSFSVDFPGRVTICETVPEDAFWQHLRRMLQLFNLQRPRAVAVNFLKKAALPTSCKIAYLKWSHIQGVNRVANNFAFFRQPGCHSTSKIERRESSSGIT